LRSGNPRDFLTYEVMQGNNSDKTTLPSEPNGHRFVARLELVFFSKFSLD
jgi:hypothetical protein